jgi:high-affinity iron transporter
VAPITGASLGLVTAIIMGYLFYRGALKINLAQFFTITGAALVVVAAGVLAYAVHDLQEAEILPGLNNTAFDATEAIPPSSWYGTLLKGLFNLSANPSWLELLAWFAYLVPVMILFFRKPKANLVISNDSPTKSNVSTAL